MYHYDVTIFGAGKTGKTALLKQVISGEFIEKHTATLQDNYRHLLQLPDGKSKSIEILDTAGSFSFPAMREVYIRNSDSFLIVMALDDKDSLEYAVNMKKEIAAIKGDSIPMLLVGNKDDVAKREISSELAAATAKEHFKSAYIETSAKSGRNCTQAFVRVLTGDSQNNAILNFVKNHGSLKKISRKSSKKLLHSTLSDPGSRMMIESNILQKISQKSSTSSEEESHTKAELMDCKVKSVKKSKPGLLRSFSQRILKRFRRSGSNSSNSTDIESDLEDQNDSVFSPSSSSKQTFTVCYTIKYTTENKLMK